LFFSAMVSIALVTSASWRQETREPQRYDEQSPSLRLLAAMVNLAIFSQLAMGAAFRHKALGITPHLIGAGVVAFLVVWSLSAVMSRFPQDANLRGWVLRLNALVMLQLVAGAAAYWIRVVTADAPQPLLRMVWITVLHVALGALVLATSVVFTWEVYRRVAPTAARAAESNVPAIS
jgi:heme A synthase